MKPFFITIYFSLLFFLALYGVHLYWMILLYIKHKNKITTPPQSSIGVKEFPFITVQLPIYNEKMVAKRLIESCVKLEYPNDKLEIQILDDSNDETRTIIDNTIAELRKQIDIPHFSVIRRENRTGYKAGALDNGLKSAKGEFIAIFDSDNLPEKDFLLHTIRYFHNDRVGMVQTRWSFLNRNESFLCRAQALFLDAHFIIEQNARYHGKLFFNFNGTAGIWRKKTIIDSGGWQFDTLTEDLDLSLRAQLAGWNFVYDSSYTVPTELPNRLSAFKSQQYRWSKGAIETAIKILPTIISSKYSHRVKIASLMHLTSKLIAPILLLLTILLIPALYFRLESGMSKILLVDLPLFIAGTGSMSLFYALTFKQTVKSNRLQSLYILPTLTSLGIALAVINSKAVLSAFLQRKTEFVRTPKSGSTDVNRQLIPKAYLSQINNTLSLEFLLAIYSSIAVILAWHLSLFFTIPFLVTFLSGYIYFTYRGIKEIYV